MKTGQDFLVNGITLLYELWLYVIIYLFDCHVPCFSKYNYWTNITVCPELSILYSNLQ